MNFFMTLYFSVRRSLRAILTLGIARKKGADGVTPGENGRCGVLEEAYKMMKVVDVAC